MAPHSSTLAWKTPWMEESGRLQSMGSLSRTRLSNFTFTHWRGKWQPTPVFLPGESQGQGSLAGCHLWSRTESDTTDMTQQHILNHFVLLLKLIPHCKSTIFQFLKKLKTLKKCQKQQMRKNCFNSSDFSKEETITPDFVIPGYLSKTSHYIFCG